MASKPNAGMKITKKDGVIFTSNVDHVKFTIEELIMAANKDVGRYIRRKVADKLTTIYKPNYSKGRMIRPRKGVFMKKNSFNTISYWARKKDLDLILGYKNHNFMTQQELGDSNYPKYAVLRNVVNNNIPEINKIQAQYISELNKENPKTDNGLPEKGEGYND